MITLLFLPNDHVFGWLHTVRGERPGAVRRRIEAGGWPFPEAWREPLAERFIVPPDLRLHATRLGEILLVYPETPLVERFPLPPPPVRLTPLQRQVLSLLSQGLTGDQISVKTHYHSRWIKAQVRAAVGEIKKRRG